MFEGRFSQRTIHVFSCLGRGGALTLGWLLLFGIVIYRYGGFIGATVADIPRPTMELAVTGVLLGFFFSLPQAMIMNDFLLDRREKKNILLGPVLLLSPAMAKYLPGKVWGMLGFLTQGKLLSTSSSFQLVFLHGYLQGLGLLASTLLCTVLLPIIFPDLVTSWMAFYSAVFLGLLGIIFVGIRRPMAWIGCKLPGMGNLPDRAVMIGHLGLMLAQKFLRGMALFIFLGAFGILESVDFWLLLFAFVAAVQIGLLAIFAPAGIGVTEGTYALVLTGATALPVVLQIALLARLWQFVIDVLASIVGLSLSPRLPHGA